MKFSIGNIVKDGKDSQLIILATKQMQLDTETLNKLNEKGTLKIVNIDSLASIGVNVKSKDYKIGKISSFDDKGWAILDNSYHFKEHWEEDIYF